MKGQHQGMDRPVIVVVAAQRGRQKSMNDRSSGGICRSSANDAWTFRELLEIQVTVAEVRRLLQGGMWGQICNSLSQVVSEKNSGCDELALLMWH